MPRMISCPCSPQLPGTECWVQSLFIQPLLHFIFPGCSWVCCSVASSFPRILTVHHASTLHPTCSQQRRCHMPTCWRTLFLGEDSSSTRNQRCIYPERIQDANG